MNRPNRLLILGFLVAVATSAACAPPAAKSHPDGSATDGAQSDGQGPRSDAAGSDAKGGGACTPTISLPIEVFGPDGTVESVTVPLAGSPAAVARLWLQAHALNYEGKASVRVNDGDWIALDNKTAAVAESGKTFGGIGGVFGTLTLTVPIAAGIARPCANTVQFRFDKSNGVSMGFRILDLDFLSSTGERLLDRAGLAEDDPAKWVAPLPGAGAIADGKALWQGAGLVTHVGPGAKPLLAHCADCHARDGRDLAYFNYTNRSIAERSKFHGLSQEQGDAIASYIRSLVGPRPGRPWNPPYQPGPGLDAKPLAEWAAGAGLGAVLARDLDALPSLFPGGIKKDAIATTATLNLRELPIAWQLPDWNRWLPTVHPKDGFGKIFDDSLIRKRYEEVILPKLLAADREAYVSTPADRGTALSQDMDHWVTDDRAKWILDRSAAGWTPDLAERIYSVGLWQLVKTWEVTQEFGLESYGPKIAGPGSESRVWMNQVPFMASPFQTLIRTTVGAGKLNLGTLNAKYLSNAWYHLQAVVNSGNRRRSGTNPIDWPYFFGFVKDLDQQTGLGEPVRFTALLAKAMQDADNGVGPDILYGWHPTYNADPALPVHGEYEVCWAGTPAATRTALLQALAGAWFDTTTRFSAKSYYDATVADASFIPNGAHSGPFANRVFFAVPKLRARGVDAALLTSICDWGKTIWPRATWDALKSHPAAWVHDFDQPMDKATFTAGADISFGMHTIDVAAVKMEIYEGETLLGTATPDGSTDRWKFTWKGVPAGMHAVTARATTSDGVISASTPVNVIVGG